jgi:hypothetical protein
MLSIILYRFPYLILSAIAFSEVNRVGCEADALQLPGFYHAVQGCPADTETVSGFGGFQQQ